MINIMIIIPNYLFIKQSDDLIINKLNNFLKENRIENKNNYKFNLPTLSKLSKKKNNTKSY